MLAPDLPQFEGKAWLGRALAYPISAVIVPVVGAYFTFIRNSPELATAYTATLGDLALGLAGSVVAAVVTYTLRP